MPARTALLLLALRAALAQPCASDLDCSLNGLCDASTGACACDAAWRGPACQELALLPSAPAIGHQRLVASGAAADDVAARDGAPLRMHRYR